MLLFVTYSWILFNNLFWISFYFKQIRLYHIYEYIKSMWSFKLVSTVYLKIFFLLLFCSLLLFVYFGNLDTFFSFWFSLNNAKMSKFWIIIVRNINKDSNTIYWNLTKKQEQVSSPLPPLIFHSSIMCGHFSLFQYG